MNDKHGTGDVLLCFTDRAESGDSSRMSGIIGKKWSWRRDHNFRLFFCPIGYARISWPSNFISETMIPFFATSGALVPRGFCGYRMLPMSFENFVKCPIHPWMYCPLFKAICCNWSTQLRAAGEKGGKYFRQLERLGAQSRCSTRCSPLGKRSWKKKALPAWDEYRCNSPLLDAAQRRGRVLELALFFEIWKS